MVTAQQIQKPTHQQKLMRQNSQFREVNLMCLTDGSVLQLLHTGPFGVPKENEMSTPGLTRILALIKKRTPRGEDGRNFPLYVAVKPGPTKGTWVPDPEMKFYDPAKEDWHHVAVMTPELESLHQLLLAQREENVAGGRALLNAAKKKAAESADATKTIVVEALGELLATAKSTVKTQAKGGAA